MHILFSHVNFTRHFLKSDFLVDYNQVRYSLD